MTETTSAAPEHLELELQADQAAARGDAVEARRLLEQITRADPDYFASWMKLAAMCRASGDHEAALGALSGALRLSPFDFTALLMKASLLEKSGQTTAAGEAYGHALAQRPEGDDLPAPIAAALAHAERQYAAHQDRLLQALRTAARPAMAEGSEIESRRIDRFCTNVVRRTQPYHSTPTHFHFPDLPEVEFHDRRNFPWLATLEAATDAIRGEFERLVASEAAELVPYIQYPEDVPLKQWAALNKSRKWTAIHLLQNGHRVEANARHCPATMEVLRAIPQPVAAGCSPNAMFSLLAPRTRIPPHVGVSNTRLVCHLPLIVPENCGFRVGAETREWQPGKAWVFDDTIEHEAWNDSDKLRVILIVDVWAWALTAHEREAAAAILAASGITGFADGGL